MAARKLGIWSSTSLVVGNMIGSGIFMLPAALAAFGGISILAWIFAALGAILLAFIFKNLAREIPHANGGPYAFTREGLGEFPAFLVAWGYWISVWCTNAAIAAAFVSYLSVFIPALQEHMVLSCLSGLGAIWFLTWLNTQKITFSGKLQLWTTLLKIMPLLMIAITGLFYFHSENFTPFNASKESFISSLSSAMTLCLFAFLGLECATIPADNIKDQARTIPRATMIGTGIAILVYVLSSTSVMGIIPPETLRESKAPFADAAAILWGEKARYLIAGGALISTFGALNGWILIQGQIPAAAAKDKLFPPIFGSINKHHMPLGGLIISSVLASVLLCLNFTKGLAETFQFILLLATLTSLLPYLFSAISYILILQKQEKKHAKTGFQIALTILGILFIIWAIIGSGLQIICLGLLLLLAGIPFYLWLKSKKEL